MAAKKTLKTAPEAETRELSPSEKAALQAEQALFQQKSNEAQLQVALNRITELTLEVHRLKFSEGESPVEK